jgi:phosphate transport system substrate-binding protein
MRARSRLAPVIAIVLFAVAFAPLLPRPALAIGPTVTGAGSTWVQIALDQWRADIARQGYQINYQGVGSSAGRQFYIINQVDFAATEIPFQPDELPKLLGEHKSFQYLPDVAGGTSLMYNLHTPAGARITSLRLDATTAARIFTGKLTSWQDPAIKALNPTLVIRETRVIPVIRSDGSGTSAQFSLYLADQAPSVWHQFVSEQNCPAPCSQWPPFNGSQQQNGSDGVANFVSNNAIGTGAMGYVEAGYAFGRGFPVASLHNASGNFTQPTSRNVATALRHATLNADLTQNLTQVYRAPESSAYPMSSYSYMVTPTTGFDPAKGAVLGTWIIYIACAGQREAAPLGYSPLPVNLIAAVFSAVRRIPGAPTPPPIDAAHCPNPNVTTPGSNGGGSGPGGTTQPTPSAGPSSGPGAGPSAGPGGGNPSPVACSTCIPTLDDPSKADSYQLALATADIAPAAPYLPLAAAAVVILLVVLGPSIGPALLRRRRRPAARGGGEDAESPDWGARGEGPDAR